MDDKVIGIVGGMGPQAGLALFQSVLCHTTAKTDQQHLPAIMISFPGAIVDRTAYLEGAASVNPALAIVNIIRKLEDAGASVIGIACNTAHAPRIYDVIVEKLDKINSQVKLLNMPRETCKHIKENYPHARRIGLMTSNGTYKSQVYKELLEHWGYDVIIPDLEFQNNIIHRMIYDPAFGIKSDPGSISREVKLLAQKALNFFGEQKADAIILGCTELALLPIKNSVKNLQVVDSTEALARALVREATARGQSIVESGDSKIRAPFL